MVALGLSALVAPTATAQQADTTGDGASFVEQAYRQSRGLDAGAAGGAYRLDLRTDPAASGGTQTDGDPLPGGKGNDDQTLPPKEVFGWARIKGEDIVWTPYNVGVGTDTPRARIDVPAGNLHLGPGAPITGANVGVSGYSSASVHLSTGGAATGDASRLVLENASTGQRFELGVEKRSGSASRGRWRQTVGGAWYDHFRVGPERTLRVQAGSSPGADGFGGVEFATPVELQAGLDVDSLKGVRAIVPDSLLDVTGPTRIAPTEAAPYHLALRQPSGPGSSSGASTVLEAADGTDLWRYGVPGEGDYTFQITDPARPDTSQHLLAIERGGNVLIAPEGNVGIGTSSPKTRLAVDGTIRARQVNVTNDDWADDVFEAGYDLRTVEEVAAFIGANGHLPRMPTEAEAAEGFDLAEMDAKLLRQVEELILYTIEQERRLEKQGERLKQTATQVRKQRSQIQAQKKQIQKQQAQIETQKKQIQRQQRQIQQLLEARGATESGAE